MLSPRFRRIITEAILRKGQAKALEPWVPLNLALGLAILLNLPMALSGVDPIGALIESLIDLDSITPLNDTLITALARLVIPTGVFYLFLRVSAAGKWLRTTRWLNGLVAMANLVVLAYAVAAIYFSIGADMRPYFISQFAKPWLAGASGMLALSCLTLIFHSLFDVKLRTRPMTDT